MAKPDHDAPDRIFTLAEANELLPQLVDRFAVIRRAKTVITSTKDEIGKASARAAFGGGSLAGPSYIRALHEISGSLQTIHELGVVIKDVDLGLCDFPAMLGGRMVYLCWKLGEDHIEWWHEVSSGFKDRRPLDDTTP
ncbi:DUF2203 family protein [Nitrospirales bacterium NOB]|nr:MAG: hypothetical protein UZ03_NOB001001163 [Nitrospira sp. OLB3]MBV6468860.1 hypothetical protein [Nitrospirota bacterium]MCE7964190.1 DUF2203 family protein [Nitrospira sp. NTP2]MCK6494427.1 DUF2203 domain-containing protein [Nitrospira sp.]MDL1890652.1 DUF2203 family protein [Nitrospirales bacterium NOB]MEB2340134.1 DUF2203 domain-containing protein [Nitrospirales bacterium]